MFPNLTQDQAKTLAKLIISDFRRAYHLQTGLTIKTADGATYKPSRMTDVDIIRYTLSVWDTCPKYAITMLARTANYYADHADHADIAELCKLCADQIRATHPEVA